MWTMLWSDDKWALKDHRVMRYVSDNLFMRGGFAKLEDFF